MHLFNIKIQSSDFRKSLKTSPFAAFSEDSSKLEASRCFLVSCPSLELLLNPLFFLSKTCYINSITTNDLAIQNNKTIDITPWLKNRVHCTLPYLGKKIGCGAVSRKV